MRIAGRKSEFLLCVLVKSQCLNLVKIWTEEDEAVVEEEDVEVVVSLSRI